MIIIHILTIVFILAGLLFSLGAAVGILRFPDFYTRVHAAGKGDTLTALLILTGLALDALFHHGFSFANVLIALKIIGVAGLILLTSPTSTHALMQAGYEEGAEPVTDESLDTQDRKS